MSFGDNKKFWSEFIDLYREQRCLWDIKSRDYCNKHMRKESLDLLVEKLKEICPEADEKFVKSKIDNMRASFRREMKKVISSKSTGKGADEVYQPTLWYFDLLMFTTDQETARKGASSLQNITEKVTDYSEDSNTEITNEIEAANSPSTLDGCNIASQSGRSSAVTTRGDLESTVTQMSRHLSSDSSTSSIQRQRKRKVVSEFEKKRDMFLDTATNVLSKVDEFTTFGSSVAFQLQDMERRQRIIAQKLVSDVMFYGKLGNLNENSNLQLNSPYPPPTNVTSFPNTQQHVQHNPPPFHGFNYQTSNNPYQPYVPPHAPPSNNTNVEAEDTVLGQFLVFDKHANRQ